MSPYLGSSVWDLYHIGVRKLMLFSLVEKIEKTFFTERVWNQNQGRFRETEKHASGSYSEMARFMISGNKLFKNDEPQSSHL